MRKTRGPRQPFLKGSLKEYTHTLWESPGCVWALFDLYTLSLWVSECTSERHRTEPTPMCTPLPFLFPFFCLGLERERDGSCVFFISLFGVDLGSVCASLSHRAPIWFVNSFVGGFFFFFFFLLRICTHVTSMKLERGERLEKGQGCFFSYY